MELQLNRNFEVDFIRGIAIILMVIFHFIFDLNHFSFIQIDIYNLNGGWQIFRNIIVFLFFLIVGVSLFLAYSKNFNKNKFFKRLSLLFSGATLITLSTYLIFPNSWIYFGVIHFIFIATIFGIWFVKYPNISLIVSILIFLGYKFNLLSTNWLFNKLQPILNLPMITEDLSPFFMWFWVILLGIFIGSKNLFGLKIRQNRISESISFLGRYSLFIYFIHQPILFGFTAIFSRIIY